MTKSNFKKPSLPGLLMRDQRGSIAVVTALIATTMFGFAGLAFDFVRGHNARSQAQSALDAAVLSAARGSFQTGNISALQTAVSDYFSKNFTVTDIKTQPVIQASITEQGTIKATVTFEVSTMLMGLLGHEGMEINVRSGVGVAGSPIEVALVLDTTGSMTGSKIDALKTSANRLLEILYTPKDAENLVKVSVVPFAEYVNIGTSRRNETWMDVPADYTISTRYCRQVQDVVGTSNCRMQTFTGNNDGTPYTYESEVCDYQYGPPYEKCDDLNYPQTWYGCAGSRNYPLNTQDGSYSTRIPGIMNVSCGAEMLPLTNNKSTVSSKISSLVAAGETYMPAGLIWGWRALSKQEPFSEGYDKSERIGGSKVRKIAVLMSDGANTRSPAYPAHNASDAKTANDLTSETCSNMKADGIEIYTVAFEVADSTARNLMKHCATTNQHYYDARQSSELVSAFEQIAISLQSLALAE